MSLWREIGDLSETVSMKLTHLEHVKFGITQPARPPLGPHNGRPRLDGLNVFPDQAPIGRLDDGIERLSNQLGD